MARTGRPPIGSRLVDKLEGSELAKARLRAILDTFTGEKTTVEAARHLDVNEARFHQLRERLLQEALAGLEPRKPGRKPKPIDPLAEENKRLRRELERVQRTVQAADARAELALAGVRPKVGRGRTKKSPRTNTN